MSAPQAALTPGATAQLEDFPVDLSWSADSQAFAVAGGEGHLYCLRRDGAAPVLLGTQEPGLLAVSWQPRGMSIATAGQDGAVRLWNAADGSMRELHRGRLWPAGIAWRADGTRLAFAAGKSLQLFDAAGAAQLTLDAHAVPLSHLVWRGRDELLTAGNGALFVDRTDGGGQITQHVIEGTPQTLALSPDLKIVANGLADGTVNFRYLNTQKRSRMSGYEGKVEQTVWSANSRYLATTSSGASSIVIWDFGGRGPEGSEPAQLNGHEERIAELAWQSGGTYLVSAGQDWRVTLWKPGPGSRPQLDVQRLESPAALARWSPDGRHLAVAETSGKIRLYTLRG